MNYAEAVFAVFARQLGVEEAELRLALKLYAVAQDMDAQEMSRAAMDAAREAVRVESRIQAPAALEDPAQEEADAAQACRRTEDAEKHKGARLAAQEKREILEEMKAFRKEFGMGCWTQVEDITCGMVSLDEIGNMMVLRRVPIEKWREVRVAMKKVRAQKEAEKKCEL